MRWKLSALPVGWHRWYAWHPILTRTRVEGEACIVWLEWVERRPVCGYDSMTYDYRLPG